MKSIPDGSVDCVICDLPYGTTANKWDAVIPFDPLWEQYHRICKPNAAIVLFAGQPFTSALIMSNPKEFRHEWIWQKNRGSNFANTVREPMKEHEETDKDHIHFLISYPPLLSVTSIVRKLKQESTVFSWRLYDSMLRKYFWKEKTLW